MEEEEEVAGGTPHPTGTHQLQDSIYITGKSYLSTLYSITYMVPTMELKTTTITLSHFNHHNTYILESTTSTAL